MVWINGRIGVLVLVVLMFGCGGDEGVENVPPQITSCTIGGSIWEEAEDLVIAVDWADPDQAGPIGYQLFVNGDNVGAGEIGSQVLVDKSYWPGEGTISIRVMVVDDTGATDECTQGVEGAFKLAPGGGVNTNYTITRSLEFGELELEGTALPYVFGSNGSQTFEVLRIVDLNGGIITAPVVDIDWMEFSKIVPVEETDDSLFPFEVVGLVVMKDGSRVFGQVEAMDGVEGTPLGTSIQRFVPVETEDNLDNSILNLFVVDYPAQ